MEIAEVIRLAIAEDIGSGDHTSRATIPADAKGSAVIVARQEGVLAGLVYAIEVFNQTDPAIQLIPVLYDGDRMAPGDTICRLEGPSRSIVAGERLALNILQRLSGIATYTRSLAECISLYPAKLLDTRKTTPLLREMEKYAVRMGGGNNHRMGLYDMIMIKDNHVDYAGGITPALNSVQSYLDRHALDLKIEVEVRNMTELEEVLTCGIADRIMLDNFSPEMLTLAIERIGGTCETEASGGITDENIVQYAATGVDFISVGALTHQIRSIDISLKAC